MGGGVKRKIPTIGKFLIVFISCWKFHWTSFYLSYTLASIQVGLCHHVQQHLIREEQLKELDRLALRTKGTVVSTRGTSEGNVGGFPANVWPPITTYIINTKKHIVFIYVLLYTSAAILILFYSVNLWCDSPSSWELQVVDHHHQRQRLWNVHQFKHLGPFS